MQYKNFKAYLADINMTIVQFSQLIGYHRSYLSNVFSGNMPMTKKLKAKVEEWTKGCVNLEVPYKGKGTPYRKKDSCIDLGQQDAVPKQQDESEPQTEQR